jgi:transposase
LPILIIRLAKPRFRTVCIQLDKRIERDLDLRHFQAVAGLYLTLVQIRSIAGMPPKVHLADHLTLEDIKVRYRQSRDPVEVRRWHLLQLVAQQWSIKQAAEIVGLSYDYAKDIIRRYNREGPESLRNRSKERPAPPTRSLLTLDQQKELRLLLQSPAPDGGEWTGPKVAKWIARKTGRSQVWPQRGWEYLRRLQE